MTVHVFVETNWVVDAAAPRHHQQPDALRLLERARSGELVLHVPGICFPEARKTIQKFQPRNEADAVRDYLGRAKDDGVVSNKDAKTVYRVLDQFEASVRAELHELDRTLARLRATPNIDVFALNDAMLSLSLELSFQGLSLQPFDQSILGGVLGKAAEFRAHANRLVFCEKDGDLQPWDRKGNRKDPLGELFDRYHVWVYGDFDLQKPAPPDAWP